MVDLNCVYIFSLYVCFIADFQLLFVIADLFTAGTETSATTLAWAIIYMLHHPEIQKQVQEEIHHHLGYDRMPRMKDKPSLPYTEACILEIQRMADIVPLGVPHTVTEDVIYRGYHLPKGTTVMSNLYSVHRDATMWKEPYTFNPQRFIDNEGKVHNRENIIPFSMGK